jgi:signal transduction histidine kinase
VPTRHFGGLGLGLYIARQIIGAHGGSIRAGSGTEGGAMFEVRLPLAAAASAPAAQSRNQSRK